MKRVNTITFMGLSIGILVIGLFLAISLGVTHIGVLDIWNSIFNYSQTLEFMLIRDVRIPRVLSVMFTGGILGVAGAMIQGITRNPIAEPSLLGVSQGATLMIAIFYAVGISINTTNVMIASLIGAIFSSVIVVGFLFKKTKSDSVTKILLAGTAMSIFFISLTTIIGLLSNQSQFIAFWVSGGFRNTTWSDFRLVAIAAVVGLILAMLLSKKINILSLGDDIATSLGENPEKIRLLTFLVMIPMCAAAVAVGKNIGFVGLITPHIGRKMFGGDYTKNIPFSFLLGSILLVYSDIAARLVYSPYETPIGIFTSLIGVPFFIAVARKERG
ncbi:iron complex transport system permease protein [Alkalithermobacter thermoalcaliphilus JW-YL-7 = DSM 7308]|uniref:ABC-type transporter, integral membrane subunit n=1 Tax=Alkalithermobacter thermoalcaliphilus JW-YL-7 = DSM 7308 TaxID=1121328 RepID=A0A150FPW2_CLOPD|nr:ABC-type transporter, integral membrane subunit [[Clostridium] paradoxum JW-YL-7 = DSM 7308]SHK86709.1 iron complex transport system permease protein [[Clostridium] paradoxum JW-YL-7 = DSM 7308]